MAHSNRWFTMVYLLIARWIFPWRTVTNNQRVRGKLGGPVLRHQLSLFWKICFLMTVMTERFADAVCWWFWRFVLSNALPLSHKQHIVNNYSYPNENHHHEQYHTNHHFTDLLHYVHDISRCRGGLQRERKSIENPSKPAEISKFHRCVTMCCSAICGPMVKFWCSYGNHETLQRIRLRSSKFSDVNRWADEQIFHLNLLRFTESYCFQMSFHIF